MAPVCVRVLTNINMKFALLLAFFVVLAACAHAAEYQWGDIGPKDFQIAKDEVKKIFFMGLIVSKKYIFKQKKIDALTITAIKVTDMKKKFNSTAEIVNGGLGSKGCTIRFHSKRGKSIGSRVEIWGR